MNCYHTVNDVYSSHKTITSNEIKEHFEHLISINNGKKVVVFLDNATIHTSGILEEFYDTHKEIFTPVFLPKYSPDMNPQENVWNFLKSKLYKPAARSCIAELVVDIQNIFSELNENPEQICSLAYARKFLE